MNCVKIWLAVLGSIALLGASPAGCTRQSEPTSAAATAGTAKKLGPEESFKLIVDTFRRGVEEIPVGFVVRREGGHSRMAGKYEVTHHELIPPASEGKPYRAVITVTSQSSYSIQRTNEADENDRENVPDDQSSAIDPLGTSEGANGLEILDPNLVGTPEAKNDTRQPAAGTPEKLIARRPDQSERKYELVHKDGRWSLVTKLDPETEQSIRNAFDQALKTQI
jgi:hypothetical protein